MKKREKIISIEEKIILAATAYYNGSPILSDEEFDALVEDLRTIDPRNKLLLSPGWGYTPESNHLSKFSHTYTVGSLNKYNVPDLLEGTETVVANDLVVTPKLDGGSAVAYYNDGVLLRILSRGDGDIGLDITKNLRHAVPSKIPHTCPVSVRGEISIYQDDFLDFDAASPRNLAVGMSQSKNTPEHDLRALVFVAYHLNIDSEMDYRGFIKSSEERVNELESLKTMGFDTVRYIVMKNFPELLDNIKTDTAGMMKYLTENHQLLTDGIVVDSTNNIPFAIKFPDEECESNVKDIVWRTSRTGRVVPVIHIEPRFLRGALISKITGNNATWIEENRVSPGASIVFVRANEVIPKLIKCLYPGPYHYSPPTHCEVCETELIRKNRDLHCPNDLCSAKTHEVVFKVMDHFKVDGVGPTSIDFIIEEFNINDITEFDDLLEPIYPSIKKRMITGLGESRTEKVLETFVKIKKENVELKDLLTFANLPSLSTSSSEIIQEKIIELYSLEEGSTFVLAEPVQTLKDIVSLSSHLPTKLSKESLENGGDIIFKLMCMFHGRVIINTPIKKGETISIAFTGSLSKPRKDLIEEFNSINHVKEVSISSAEYLITDNPNGSSKKLIDARKKGTKVISETEFREILKKNS